MPLVSAPKSYCLFDIGLDGISLNCALAHRFFSKAFEVNAASTNCASKNIADTIVV